MVHARMGARPPYPIFGPGVRIVLVSVAERRTAHLGSGDLYSQIISGARADGMRGDDMRRNSTVPTTLFALRPW
jgi:hypothetical protein